MAGFSKDDIKGRMLRRVASLWDVRNVDRLDPIVKLMIEALSGEIHRLWGESSDSGMRIFETMARALTPSNLLSAQPAHAIVMARALSGVHIIDRSAAFDYKNPVYLKKFDLNKLSFTPVGSPQVVDGAVRYMISGGRLFSVDGSNIKDHMAGRRERNPVYNNTLWIGIETGRGIKSLKDLSLYFDFPYSDNREEYYVLLPHIKWSVNGRRLDAKGGLYLESCGDDLNPLSKYKLRNIVEREIIAKYDHRFITITTAFNTSRSERSLFPQELDGILEPTLTEEFDKPLVWLKAEFPDYFTDEIVESATVCLNAFPVANKYLKSDTKTLGFSSSIMPLDKDSNEYFLGIESVADSYGRTYSELQADGEEGATYTIRRGGCERYNGVDAREYLMRLIDMLRDESMAFSRVNKDTIGTNAMDLLAQIDMMEYKSGVKSDLEENASYLIFDSLEENVCDMTATYWLSNGRLSSGIRGGERLDPVGDLDVDASSVVLLTAPKGGYEAPSEAKRTETFKFTLISHGSVYSKDDIRSFVLSRYGDFIARAEVSRGYCASNIPKEGIVRTIDVRLTPRQHLTPDSRADLKEDILFNLRRNSPVHFNYKVMFI